VALLGSEAPLPGQEQGGIETVACDLTNRIAIESALVRIEDRLGPLEHLLLGTDAPGRQAPLHAATRADWANAVDAPLAAAFHLCQAALARLATRRQGSLLFVLSDYAIIGLRDGAAFAAGQAALYSFAKSLAREFAPLGIRVNCVGTGWMPAAQSGVVPMGRPAGAEDAAAAADYLLSDRASYVTGQLLQPNGGRVMW
jgi:NAD(P)-dependent dehydrogenase (short-subunit alcohol dehydrogenase family)